jgi:hypothetical protein
MTRVQALIHVLTGRAEFARGGGAKSAKAGGKGGKSAKKGKGVTQASSGGLCCKDEGGKFAMGNNYGSAGGARSRQKAAAKRVQDRLAVKSQGAKAAAAAKAASATPATGGIAGMIARSKAAAAKGGQVKAERDKSALEKKQARNAKVREKRAAKKEAQKQEAAKPSRERGIKAMVAKSKEASAKAGTKNAEAKRAALEKYDKVVLRKTPASPKQINKVAKDLEASAGPSKRAAAKVKAKADAAAGPINESKAATYGGRKELVMSRTDNAGPAGGSVLTIRQVAHGKQFQVFEGDARAAGSGRGVREIGTFDSLGAAKKFGRAHLTGAPKPAVATLTPKEELSQAIAAIRKDKGLSRTKMARQIKHARQTIRDTTDENQAKLDTQKARAERRRAEKARQPMLPLDRSDRAATLKRMTDRSRVASGKAGAENAARKRAAAEPKLPPRTADTMSDAIALSSPSGKMSKRAREAANKRLNEKLFGPQGLPAPSARQPSEVQSLRQKAAELKGLADRGMKPRAYAKEAAKLNAKADALENRRPAVAPVKARPGRDFTPTKGIGGREPDLRNAGPGLATSAASRAVEARAEGIRSMVRKSSEVARAKKEVTVKRAKAAGSVKPVTPPPASVAAGAELKTRMARLSPIERQGFKRDLDAARSALSPVAPPSASGRSYGPSEDAAFRDAASAIRQKHGQGGAVAAGK